MPRRPSAVADLRSVSAPASGAALVASLLGAVVVLGGCAALRPSTAATAPAAPPLGKVATDEDYGSVRPDYDALDVSDPRRPATRAALERWLLDAAHRELAAHRLDAAVERFHEALTLYDASELYPRAAADAAPRIDDAPLADLAADLEQRLRRRGSHQPTVLTLAVELTLRPDDAGARARYAMLRDWLLEVGAEDGGGKVALLDDLGAVAQVWPARFVVDELARLYAGAAEARGRGGRSSPLFATPEKRDDVAGGLRELLRLQGRSDTGLQLASLYLRVSRLDEAAAALHRRADGDDDKLREAVDRLAAPTAKPEDAIALAQALVRRPDDFPVAERVCRDATRRFPRAPEPWLCVGEIATQLGHLTVAIRAFEAARELAPAKRDAWEALGQLYQGRLFQLASDDRLDDLVAELGRVEAFHAAARQRFPDAPLNNSLARALVEVARGFYNAGKIDETLRYCQRSMAVAPTVDALEQMAMLEARRGRGADAIKLYQRALVTPPAAPATGDAGARPREAHYWRAKLQRGLGDALDLAGETSAARGARTQALAEWAAFLHDQRRDDPETVAEVEVERGKLLYLLGERDEALASLERAIDVAPRRGSTYGDVMAFLVPRGEREEALDAFHRALGRAEISEYLKVYCSLWMTDLDRRSGLPEDPLARAFLDGVDGSKWYDDLARWATGRETDAQLEAHADTPAKRAEASFYESMRRLEQRDATGARALWKKVIDTEMMAFFEYDMASYYLRHGAATEPVLKSKPKGARGGGAAAASKIPDGSI